jgi:dUTP pyrophosphatase
MSRRFEILPRYADEGLKLPERKTKLSAGYDFCARVTILCRPGEVTLVPTGVKAYMEDDDVLKMYIRSGLAFNNKLMLVNNTGIIDADYVDNPENEGEIILGIYNAGRDGYKIEKDQRVAQGIFEKYQLVDEEKPVTTKRKSGMGSTGVTG